MSRGSVNIFGGLFGGRSQANADASQRINEMASISSTRLLTNMGPNGITIDDPNQPIQERTVLGVLVNKGPNGEADHTDDGYWVMGVQLTQSADDGPDDPLYAYPELGVAEGFWFTAHNTSEIMTGTHLLHTIAPPTDPSQELDSSAVIVRVRLYMASKQQPTSPHNVVGVFEKNPLGSVFPVRISNDGGVAGGVNTTCNLTYTVKDISNNSLSNGSSNTTTLCSPEHNTRLANVTYSIPSNGSIAIACYDAASPPVLHLLYVPEKPSPTQCT